MTDNAPITEPIVKATYCDTVCSMDFNVTQNLFDKMRNKNREIIGVISQLYMVRIREFFGTIELFIGL